MDNNFSHNCSVEASCLEPVIFEPDTFMPMNGLNLKVKILSDFQYDGHLRKEVDVRHSENELIDVIMQKIHIYVEDAVRKVKPFNIHSV